MKNKPLIFALFGAGLIIAMLFTINYMTSMSHPWFVYPAFAVLWWPLSVFFAQNKKYKAFSIVGGLYIAAFSYLVNVITSPDFYWFVFPTFAVLWWPLSINLATIKKPKLFSVVASLYIVCFLALINYMTNTPLWFIYPAFAVLWWPLSVIICGAKKYKLYAIVSTVYITGFLALVNYLTSPNTIWFFHVIYGLLWWPMSMMLAKKPKVYSIVMSLITLTYFITINYMYSPDGLWYPYAVFNLIWWPLVMLLGKKAGSVWFAVVGALSIIAYYVFLYFRLTPGAHLWYLYIVLPAIWWPVTMAFKKHAAKIPFLLISLVIFVAYYTTLNLILMPDYFWAINLIYPALWAVMGIYFGRRRKFFAFSICAAIVTIVYFSILNYMTTPHIIWAVYPSFAILWWPLSMYFFNIKKEKPQKNCGLDSI